MERERKDERESEVFNFSERSTAAKSEKKRKEREIKTATLFFFNRLEKKTTGVVDCFRRGVGEYLMAFVGWFCVCTILLILSSPSAFFCMALL